MEHAKKYSNFLLYIFPPHFCFASSPWTYLSGQARSTAPKRTRSIWPASVLTLHRSKRHLPDFSLAGNSRRAFLHLDWDESTLRENNQMPISPQETMYRQEDLHFPLVLCIQQQNHSGTGCQAHFPAVQFLMCSFPTAQWLFSQCCAEAALVGNRLEANDSRCRGGSEVH